jgi:hypothetical protein
VGAELELGSKVGSLLVPVGIEEVGVDGVKIGSVVGRQLVWLVG